jgi:two-component system NtrC family sensor kinase
MPNTTWRSSKAWVEARTKHNACHRLKMITLAQPNSFTMKKAVTLVIFLLTIFTAAAQRKQIDSLNLVIRKAVTDTDKYNALHDLGLLYTQSYPDSGILFSQQAFLLAKKNNWAKNQARQLGNIASDYANMGDYATALQYYFKDLRIAERFNFQVSIIIANLNIGDAYLRKEDYQKSLPYSQLAYKQLQDYARNHQLEARYKTVKPIILVNIGEAYLGLHKLDSAKYYMDAAYKRSRETNDRDVIGPIQRDLGEMEGLKGNSEGALQYYRQALVSEKAVDDAENLSIAYLSIARLYHKNKLQDSALYYGQKALDAAAAGNFKQDVLNAGKALYQYYDEAHDLPQAFKYFKLTTTIKDSLYSQDKVKQLLTLDFNEKQRQQELDAAKAEAQNRLRTYILSGGLGVLLLLALIFWLNGRQRQKANKLLRRQKADIEAAMSQLKLTQNQLIQSEKMASLGELTAGIAHEIQNPLNFVNNFSEVNRELLLELKAESEKPKAERDAQVEVELINDLIDNEQKITHHGKRADFIVKGMLQHSRTSTGERQLTNINTLADEFFKLSYQGLRAKDKNFNSEMVTHFDPDMPKVNVVQQDIGRVFLNLFNNAFYAVNQKAKTSGPDYKPTVEITTFAPPPAGGGWGVMVRDNGVGIPDAIKEKILQPFFTTKPTGEGTGLGLSLSYDILVKGNNGTLDINSKEGEGSEFIVRLPMN